MFGRTTFTYVLTGFALTLSGATLSEAQVNTPATAAFGTVDDAFSIPVDELTCPEGSDFARFDLKPNLQINREALGLSGDFALADGSEAQQSEHWQKFLGLRFEVCVGSDDSVRVLQVVLLKKVYYSFGQRHRIYDVLRPTTEGPVPALAATLFDNDAADLALVFVGATEYDRSYLIKGHAGSAGNHLVSISQFENGADTTAVRQAEGGSLVLAGSLVIGDGLAAEAAEENQVIDAGTPLPADRFIDLGQGRSITLYMNTSGTFGAYKAYDVSRLVVQDPLINLVSDTLVAAEGDAIYSQTNTHHGLQDQMILQFPAVQYLIGKGKVEIRYQDASTAEIVAQSACLDLATCGVALDSADQ